MVSIFLHEESILALAGHPSLGVYYHLYKPQASIEHPGTGQALGWLPATAMQ